MSNYTPRRLAGRCADGAERDGGTRVHALPEKSYKALCGAEPGRRSAGWSSHPQPAVTCPRCLKKLEDTQRWYHNGTDTFDGPEIRRFATDEYKKGFWEGPFESFSEAKKDLIQHYKQWKNTASDAISLAKAIRKSDGESHG